MAPNSPAPGSRNRSIRLPDKLWEDAHRRASEHGETLAEVIRKFLERYTR